MSERQTNSNYRSTNDPIKVLKILGLVFGVIGLTMLAVALIIFLVSTVFTSYTAQTEGTVVSLLSRTDKAIRVQAPEVAYVIDGKKYFFISEIYSSLSQFKPGDKVTIHYEPANPQNAQMDFGVGQLISLILGIIGLAFSLTSVAMWFGRSRLLQKRTYVPQHPSL